MNDEATTPADPAPGAPAAGDPPAPAAAGGRGLALLALVVALGGIGAGYFAWQRGLAPRAATLAAGLAEESAARRALAGELDAARSRISRIEEAERAVAADTARVEALEAAQAALGANVEALAARAERDPLEWLLAETEYLVFAASQRLALLHDAATARAALEAADARLRDAAHPRLTALRARLAEDIGALAAVGSIDTEGLALALADAAGRVGELPTKPIAELDLSFAATRGEEASSDNWRGLAAAIWNDILGLVEVKDGELPDSVLFDPKLRYFLQQNLRLELASARLAVLERDTANFRAAGRLVRDILARYYDADARAVAALDQWFAERESLELAPPLPTLAGSLDAVRAARGTVAADAAP